MARKEFGLFPIRDAKSNNHTVKLNARDESLVPELDPRHKYKRFKFFAMRNFRQNSLPELPAEEPDTEFKRKYPPDTGLGQELAENARVWHVYRDQAIQHDDGLLAGWNNTINILLTFAGLFSAAVTAFVVESYQFLQPPGLDLGLALYSLAVNDTATLLSLATSHSQPSSPARWINGLWFTSLFFSLAAAFLCILVKQWLDEYTARTRASSQNPKHWTRRRTFYFRAIDAWGVPVIISLLPLLLHTALFLFFAGVVVLLWSLNRALAAWLSSLALPALCLYVISLLIPVWNAACPFATPLARLVPYVVSMYEIVAVVMFHLERLRSRRPLLGAIFPHPRSVRLWTTGSIKHDVFRKTAFDQVVHLDSLPSGEDPDAKGSDIALVDRLDCDALCWMIQSVSDTDASAVAFQALGAAEPCSDLAEQVQVVARGLTLRKPQHFVTGPNSGGPVETARVVKSIILLRDFEPASCLAVGIDGGWTLLDSLRPGRTYPDVQLLRNTLMLPSCVSSDFFEDISYTTIRDAEDWDLSPSLQLTSVLLSIVPGFGQPHVLLFLSLCNLSLVTAAQWAFLMPTLWGTDGPCPRHRLDLCHCRATCLAELISRLLLGSNLDKIVLTRLWEKACSHLPVLCDLPDFLRYITSETFLSCKYSEEALWYIQYHLNDSRSWVLMPTVDLTWLTAWRYLVYSVPLHSTRTHPPGDLISSALAFCGDRHRIRAQPFARTLPAEQVLRFTLETSRLGSRSIPSVWQLLINNYHSPFTGNYYTLLDALARSLCSLSRTDDDVDELIDALFAMRFERLMSTFHLTLGLFDGSNASASYLEEASRLRTTFVEISRHLMELRPLWWAEGLEVVASQERWVSSFAEELTAEVLYHGPCSDCPLSNSSRTFDVSLRNFVPFPFWVYPLVDSGTESA